MTRLRRFGEMPQQLPLVEGEIRRRDHRHGIGTRGGCVLCELRRVGGALGPAVHGDLQVAFRLEKELRDALPVLDVEEHALSRRPEREDPVDAV